MVKLECCCQRLGFWFASEASFCRALTESVDVGVVDLGAEEDLGGDHGVIVGEEQLQVEHSAFVGRVSWTSNLDEEVSAVGLRWLSVDAHNYHIQNEVCLESAI